MSVSRYFGLPGCGKTTTLTRIAYKALRSRKYKNVYTNVHLEMPGVTYVPFDVLGQFELRECIVLIDEATVFIGDRDYKTLARERLQYFLEHRHHYCDIVLFSQDADGVDKKVRSITDRMYWVRKGIFLGHWVTTIYRIPYKVIFPKEDSGGEAVGQILMGYVKPGLLARLFADRYFRKPYYKYFDSWEVEQLKPLPKEFKAIPGSINDDLWFFSWFFKTSILLCWSKKYQKQLRKAQRLSDHRSGAASSLRPVSSMTIL